ncbi:transforming growth factor-beta-induced protein ig-h3-like isoform X2 [Daphnia pulicaria]|uniref:transforming growth factor-beta-induced protein ig-h3-like isoform X2 n=1 Tax=Daphnia pulicaria TaxID=35523 RepID=UPI001EEBBF58|nr:transforming growth factor-beta-induced protein ig-h3-like isoform X2 [Daphnia pulicaria]
MKFLILIASISVVVLAASTVAYTPSRYSHEQRQQQPSSPAHYRTPAQPSYRSDPAPAPVNTPKDISALLKENGLTVVLDLMAKAGLSETLNGPELTIWAPTNEAFAASELKNLNDVDLLKNVLSYHLVSFKNDPKEISSIQYELSVPTLQGENVRISVYRKKGVSFAFDETVTINGALVLKTLRASNGIIYIIDRVLDPKDLAFKNTQMEVLRNTKEFSIIYKMFEDLGITLVSDKYRPKTFFAPTNAAFEALPAGALDAIFASQDEIGKLINTHTASGTHYSRGLVSGPVPVFSGSNLDLVVSPNGVTVDNAKIIGVDLTNTEGVIHVIDAVIPNKPETPSAMCTAPVKNY